MVIFGAGVVTGGLLVEHSRARAVPKQLGATANRPPVPISPGGMRLDFLRRIQRELDLTPNQQEQVHKILEEGQERTRKQIHEEMHKIKDSFRAVLTPEQQVRFDDLLKQQEKQQQQRGPHDQHHPSSARDHLPENPVPVTNLSPTKP